MDRRNAPDPFFLNEKIVNSPNCPVRCRYNGMTGIRLCIFWLLCVLPTVVLADAGISNSRLEFVANPAGNVLTVKDKKTGRKWTASFDQCAETFGQDEWQHICNPQYVKFDLCKAESTSPSTMKLTVKDGQNGRTYFLDAELKDNALVFELSSSDMNAPLTGIGLPPVFTTELADGHLVFCDRSCGVLKKQTDFDGYTDTVLDTYANTSCLDMPWVGVVDMKAGDGVMILFETPLDSAMHLRKTQGGIWPQPLWKSRMGALKTRRRISYHFSDSGGYVALAGMYRNHQQEQDKFKTLAQKTTERPNVERLTGSPPIWGDGDVFAFLHEARNLGVTKAIFGNAERGDRGRTDMEKLNRMGYLTLRYDSYSDILDGKTWFQHDDVKKTAYVLQPGGEPLKGWQTLEGLQYYSRSSAYALQAAQTYSKPLIEDAGMNADFIDVMGAMDLMEDYHPEHTFDREQDRQFKRSVFKYYTDKSLVIGTEHGNDWALDLVDYTEGSLSGSLWWIPGENTTGWNPGHLQRPVSRDDFSPLYLKYGVNPANRIPLWQLVYHDCAMSTWYWGDSAGWFYEVAPEISEQKDLETILYGALPLFWRDDYRGYNWSKHKDRWLESYYLTVKFHAAVFGQQMLSHTFITDDRLVQKTEFKNGALVLVNFRSENYRTELDGQPITLPPNGFYAKAPGIEQGRILQNGAVWTFVKAKDFFYSKSNAASQTAPLAVAGEVVLFRLDDNRWNLLFRPASRLDQLDAAACEKFIGRGHLKVYPLSTNWEIGAEIKSDGTAPLRLNSGNYAIILGASTPQ